MKESNALAVPILTAASPVAFLHIRNAVFSCAHYHSSPGGSKDQHPPLVHVITSFSLYTYFHHLPWLPPRDGFPWDIPWQYRLWYGILYFRFG
ncbi:hypothetical protein CC78DRAFT_263212 [Lojkania enalia]|uniref:Uncharacterized protein n=1 Tax=Lojkania enalia TaxID=147567 RepID=A0A9P4N3T3_9PLEO|nr:hypothetical protein CC78DRAFT_263212 [Didymosphaeria enalia]